MNLLAQTMADFTKDSPVDCNTLMSYQITRLFLNKWEVHLQDRKLTSASGRHVTLTKSEVYLLCIFLQHPNQVVSRDALMNFFYNTDAEPFDRRIDLKVSRLRKKINQIHVKPNVLKPVRNKGYMLEIA